MKIATTTYNNRPWRQAAGLAARMVLAWLAAAGSAGPARAAEIPAGPKAPVEAEIAAKVYAHASRVLLEGYRQCGMHNPALDERCEKFLDRSARMTSLMRGAPTDEELAREGMGIYLDGCDDPLVLYALARSLQRAGYRGDAEEMNKRAADGLWKRRYPPLLRVWASRRLWSMHDLKPEEVAKQGHLDDMIKAWAEVMRGGTYRPDEQEVLVRDLVAVLRNLPPPYSQRVFETVRDTPGVDPLVLHVAAGCHDVNMGSLAAGLGWMSTQGKEGKWEWVHDPPKDGDYFGRAKEHLVEAWKLDPKQPVAACLMMNACRGTDDERLWFDRAVAARLDYRPAYGDDAPSKYLHIGGVRKGWWLGLAEEYLRTGRYDTMVPSRYTDALLVQCRFNRVDYSPLRKPGAYENALRVCQGYIADPGATPRDKGHWRTMLIGFAVLTGHWADARKALDDLGRRPESAEMDLFGLLPRLAAGAALAHTGPNDKLVLQANDLRRQGKVDEALAAFADALDKTTDPDEAWYLRDVMKRIRWARDFQAGKWVRLEADKGLPGWVPNKGWWSAGADGTLVGRSREGYCGVVWNELEVGSNVELKATVCFDPVQDDEWQAGVGLGCPEGIDFYNVTLNTNGHVEVGPRYYERKSKPAEIKPINELLIRQEGRKLTVTVNGKKVFDQEDMDFISDPPSKRVGGYIRSTMSGLDLRMVDLQVRKAQ